MRWASVQASGPRPLTYIPALLAGVLCLQAAHARADGAIDAWASWALAPKVWKGQTVPAPDPTPRPAGAFIRLDSLELPIHVHVPAGSSSARATRTLSALEAAYLTLRALDWPLPAFDGGYGGSAGFDLYVVPRGQCAGACAAVDGLLAPIATSDFDAAQTYGLIAADLPASALRACAQSALAQAGLRAVDPSEAESWVRASAELSVWQTTGSMGCDESFVRGQLAPEQGLLNADPSSGDAGALLLAMLAERVERTPFTWLKSLWETTRQRSRDLVPVDRLRSSPDLWEVLRVMLDQQHVTLEDELLELSAARYFAGPSARREQAPYRFLAALPSEAAVPIARELESAQLPAHVIDGPLLRALGSVYVRVRLSDATRREQLRLWLRAEVGPRWAMTAVRLDGAGRELGRMSAPPREVPNSFLPVAIDTETAEVIVVITQLPKHTPDADRREDGVHGYELIVD
ncbi:MAG: hypothetical protein ABW321_10495 [Polyangiales bacterium]